MKIRYLLALLVIAMISACAPAEPPASEPVAPPPEPEPVVTEPEEVIEPVEPEGPEMAYVEVMYAGYDPTELTVKVGTVIEFTSIQGNHKLTANGKGQPSLEEGASQEITADKVGTLRIFDIFTKKTLSVEVVEEMPEAMVDESGSMTEPTG